jgi:hypothetical protein
VVDLPTATLFPHRVDVLWGVGPATRHKYAEHGIHTVAQLAESPWRDQALAPLADERRVRSGGRAGSVGAQSAFGRQFPTDELLASVLGHLADRVAGRLRAKHRAGRTVTVRIRFAGMRAITRSRTGAAPVAATLTSPNALAWSARAWPTTRRAPDLPARDLGVNLVDQPAVQLDLLGPNLAAGRSILGRCGAHRSAAAGNTLAPRLRTVRCPTCSANSPNTNSEPAATTTGHRSHGQAGPSPRKYP